MSTTLNTCQKKNLNEQGNWLMYWMWWMKQMYLINYTFPKILTIIWMKHIWKQTKLTHLNMKTQMIQTMTQCKLQMHPKPKEYPSYPHASGRMEAMANGCPHRSRIVV